MGGLFICSFYDIDIPHIGKLSTILMGTLFSIVGYLFGNKQQLQMYLTINVMKAIYINNVLCYMGKHTMIIFALHFLAFKVVSAIIIDVLGFEYVRLSEFPVITNISSFWWLAYSLMGLLLPLFAIKQYRKF